MSVFDPPSMPWQTPSEAAAPSHGGQLASIQEAEKANAKAGTAVTAPLDMAYFRNHSLRMRGNIQDHNAALKCIRNLKMPHVDGATYLVDLNGDGLWVRCHDLPLHGSINVRKVLPGEGHTFDFDMTDNGWMQWSWQQMVSHLSDESLKYVVDGPEGRGGGIVKCSVDPRCGSYDHKTQKQGKHEPWLPVYDFVIWRKDGSCVSMHPSWDEIQILCHEGHPSQLVWVPALGVGGVRTFRCILMSAQCPIQLDFRQ